MERERNLLRRRCWFNLRPALPWHRWHGEVRHGKNGNIVLYCPVSDPGFKPTLLGLVYYDDSRDAGNHVTAQLIKMDISTGAITPLVKVDSDSGAVSANGKANLVPHTFTENYDFKNFAYYIRVDIARNTPTANETVYAVSLQN
jgi:hypothetical protein